MSEFAEHDFQDNCVSFVLDAIDDAKGVLVRQVLTIAWKGNDEVALSDLWRFGPALLLHINLDGVHSVE